MHSNAAICSRFYVLSEVAGIFFCFPLKQKWPFSTWRPVQNKIGALLVQTFGHLDPTWKNICELDNDARGV